ncbi:MAG: hypothetical protein QMD01_03495 [Thermodesulfovibrionales bacterium]|nr:hypothetical protein [Thermodesulfovibrionales bacterium]
MLFSPPIYTISRDFPFIIVRLYPSLSFKDKGIHTIKTAQQKITVPAVKKPLLADTKKEEPVREPEQVNKEENIFLKDIQKTEPEIHMASKDVTQVITPKEAAPQQSDNVIEPAPPDVTAEKLTETVSEAAKIETIAPAEINTEQKLAEPIAREISPGDIEIITGNEIKITAAAFPPTKDKPDKTKKPAITSKKKLKPLDKKSDKKEDEKMSMSL